MSNDSSAIVQKVPPSHGYGEASWNYPPSLKLRRAGSEMTELGFYPPSPKLFGGTSKPIPAEFQWSELSGKSGKSGDPPSPSAFAKASADKRLRLAGELEPNGARWTFWKDCEVVQQPVARVRWSSNLVLLKKLATEPKPSLAA